MRGWIKLHRQLLDNPMWIAEKFTRGQAWADLILLANHKDGVVVKRGVTVKLSRGDVGWSESALAKRWKWSRGKIRRFLNHLTEQKMIQKISGIETSVSGCIRILNYGRYQDKFTVGNTEDNTENDTVNDTEDGTGTRSKEVKNIDILPIKPDPVPYSEIVNHLNEKTGRKFKRSNSATQRLIKARFKNGFTLDDFIAVIDSKTTQWKEDKQFNQYLRPSTLFGPKFEEYLQASITNRQSSTTECKVCFYNRNPETPCKLLGGGKDQSKSCEHFRSLEN